MLNVERLLPAGALTQATHYTNTGGCCCSTWKEPVGVSEIPSGAVEGRCRQHHRNSRSPISAWRCEIERQKAGTVSHAGSNADPQNASRLVLAEYHFRSEHNRERPRFTVTDPGVPGRVSVV